MTTAEFFAVPRAFCLRHFGFRSAINENLARVRQRSGGHVRQPFLISFVRQQELSLRSGSERSDPVLSENRGSGRNHRRTTLLKTRTTNSV